MKYGYACISANDQNPSVQLAALKNAGCQTVFKDEGLLRATMKRPALLRCLKKLAHGDTLIVWKFDRLGRSLRDLIMILDDLHVRSVKFHSLTEAIDTATPTGWALWQVVGVLTELKKALISERTRAGVEAAQRRGVKFGRKVKLTPKQIDHARKLLGKGESSQYVADLFNVVRSTLYRSLRELDTGASEIPDRRIRKTQQALNASQ